MIEPALGFEFSHSENIWRRQKKQLPHDIWNGTTTRSPMRRLRTAERSNRYSGRGGPAARR